MLERERLIEIVVAVAGVAVLYALLFYVGASYTTTTDGRQVLTPEGGQVVVFSIAAFVLVMAAAGFVLLHRVTAVEAGESSGSDGAGSEA